MSARFTQHARTFTEQPEEYSFAASCEASEKKRPPAKRGQVLRAGIRLPTLFRLGCLCLQFREVGGALGNGRFSQGRGPHEGNVCWACLRYLCICGSGPCPRRSGKGAPSVRHEPQTLCTRLCACSGEVLVKITDKFQTQCNSIGNRHRVGYSDKARVGQRALCASRL